MALGKALGILLIVALVMLALFWFTREDIKKEVIKDLDKKKARLFMFIAYCIFTGVVYAFVMLFWLGIHLIIS